VFAYAVQHDVQTKPDAAWIALIPYVRLGLLGVPVLAALILGSSLIGSELEQGTVAFAWSLSSSRRRWLFETSGAGLLLALITTLPVAAASGLLSASLGPMLDATSSPVAIDPSALLVLARPLAAFGVAALCGIILGRPTTTLMVALIFSCVVLGAVEVGFSAWRDSEVTLVDTSDPGVLYVGDRLASPNGDLLDDSRTKQLLQTDPHALEEYQLMPVGLMPDSRERMMVAETAVYLLVCAGSVVLGAVAVDRRGVG